jgi:hypothetical protein
VVDAYGWFSDSGAAWALVIRDGLAFRMKGAASLSEAFRVLREDDWSSIPDTSL